MPEGSRNLSLVAANRRPENGSFLPASFAQERLWFLHQLKPNAAYNIPLAFRIKGRLNRDFLEQCLNQIIERHETLRTHFEAVEGHLVQIVAPFVPFKIPFTDLRSLPRQQREERAIQSCVEDARRPFDLKEGSIFRVRLFQLETNDYVLLVNIHHIASDGWSMSVFFHELNALYTACVEGKPAKLPELPIQYADFSA
ncbi:MAG: condensation domain-containing protein, partial [Limisphaerales bacterium]